MRAGRIVSLLAVTLPLVCSSAALAAGPRQLSLVLPLASDRTGLTRFADAVSDPSSPSYQHYASVAWLSRHFGASAAVRARVVGYLRAHGARQVRVDATGQDVYADLSVAAAERLFRVRLTRGRAAHDAGFMRPSDTVQLPRGLRGAVTGVIGLDTAPVAAAPLTVAPTPPLIAAPAVRAGSLFDQSSAVGEAATTTTSPTQTTTTTTSPAQTATPPTFAAGTSAYPGSESVATASGCSAGVATAGFTPNEYLSAYNYSPLQREGLRGQGERAALIEIDGFKTSDIRRFAQCFGLPAPKIRAFGPSRRVGLLTPGPEATLDLEVLTAAAPALKSIDVYETEPDAAAVLKAIADPLQVAKYKPEVISVSLGLCESQTLAGTSQSLINATETVLKVAAAAGVTVLGAAGDFGSAACARPGSNPAMPLPELAVSFPASSPWATSVGGTNLILNQQNQIVDQIVWNDGLLAPGDAGGGGFSLLFSRPAWQRGVVSGDERAVPDVAMLADISPGYAVYCTTTNQCTGRGWLSFGGTSAATPLLAGGIVLVDQLLRRQGRQGLGFANRLLYRLGANPVTAAQVFYDVTQGSNDVGPYIQASQLPLGCCSAQVGYDEASGWGGVDLQAFARQALAATAPIAAVTDRPLSAQNPLRERGLTTRVSCSAACDMSAYVRIHIGAGPSFTDYGPLVHVARPATRSIKVVFTSSQIHRMRAALRAHRRIGGVVVATVTDAAGDILRRTAPRSFSLAG
ncbi:MAG: S53 family peptidase [Solirubrobacteraceae bacterium]